MYKSVSKIPKETGRVEFIKQLLLSLKSFILESSLGNVGAYGPGIPGGGLSGEGIEREILGQAPGNLHLL